MGGATEVSFSSSLDYFEDVFGNKVVSKSDANIILKGHNSSVVIEQDVKLFNKKIVIGDNVNLHIGKGCKICPSKFKLNNGTTLEIGRDVHLWGGEVFINNDSSVFVGSRTTIGSIMLRTGSNQCVRIGEDCLFSWNTTVLAHDGHLIWDVQTEKCKNNTIGEQRESIVIGDHVWAGAETAFLPKTKVGSGSICAFRSVVSGTIPNNCICAGIPAKVIKRDIAWSRSKRSVDDRDFYSIDEKFRKYTEE